MSSFRVSVNLDHACTIRPNRYTNHLNSNETNPSLKYAPLKACLNVVVTDGDNVVLSTSITIV